jgi:hypothetical protein
MGRTVTPTFRVEMFVPGWHITAAVWDCKRQGRPSDKTLAADVASFEASTLPGGANAHLGFTVVQRARIIRQSTNEIVAEYQS